MVIHSVTPPQMLMEQSAEPVPQCLQVPGGYLEGQRTPQGFRMSRLITTDPALYLRPDLAPGSYLREPGGKELF